MKHFFFRIDFAYKTYTGSVRADSEQSAKTIAEERIIVVIMKDYGFETENEAWGKFDVHGKTMVSEKPIEGRRPVLCNMLTGEKVVGPPGMSEAMLFESIANGEMK